MLGSRFWESTKRIESIIDLGDGEGVIVEQHIFALLGGDNKRRWDNGGAEKCNAMHCPRDSGEKRTSWTGFDNLLQEIRGVFCCDDDGGVEDNN